MDTDYRKLCKELFGTDDVDALRAIAEDYHAKNPRNAGRKKKFTEEEVCTIRSLREAGMTIADIAERYNTSRQVIHRYLNPKPEPGYTFRMVYMYQQHPCTIIDVDFAGERIKILNRTEDLFFRAFGVIQEPTWDDFEYFLRERCFPESRGNKKEILNALQLTAYDPLQIIEKTQGRMAEDNMWLKIQYYPENGGVYA